jgi:signal peptidase II
VRRNRRPPRIACLITVVTLVLDQLTKIWALHALTPRVEGGGQVRVIGDFITFRLVFNPGAALGMGYGYTWLLTIIVVAVVTAIIISMRRLGSLRWAVTLGLLLGGALGNLGDRLFRAPGFAQGHVVDFIGYHTWFTGNVADIAIVAAAIAMAALAIIGIGLDGQRHAAAPSGSGNKRPANSASASDPAAHSTPAAPSNPGAPSSPGPSSSPESSTSPGPSSEPADAQ